MSLQEFDQVLTYPQLDQILEDLHKLPLVMSGERGSGKTEALKALIAYAKRTLRDRVIFKVFDPCLAWFTISPLETRVRVTEYDIIKGRVKNGSDLVYFTGELSIRDRQAFIASIIKSDYSQRYHQILENGISILQLEPLIIYVVEEAQVVIGSYALRSNSPVSDVMKDFISMGRNIGYDEHGLTGIFTTQRISEVSTEVVERCNMLIGKQLGDNNRKKIKRSTDTDTFNKVRNLDRYHFVYYSGVSSKPFKIPRWYPPPKPVVFKPVPWYRKIFPFL